MLAELSRKLSWTIDQWQRPTFASGGDFVVHRHDGCFLRVFVGDVAGHDQIAARAATRFAPVIRRELSERISNERLRCWNRLAQRQLGDLFVAFTWLQIDLRRGEATIVNVADNLVVADGNERQRWIATIGLAELGDQLGFGVSPEREPIHLLDGGVIAGLFGSDGRHRFDGRAYQL